MRNPVFCICENKVQISCAVAAQLISTFVFVTSLYFLNASLTIFCGYTAWFMSVLVRNTDDRFAHDIANIQADPVPVGEG